MSRAFGRSLISGTVALASVGLVACGGAAKSQTVATSRSAAHPTAPAVVPDPPGVVARVGTYSIAGATFARWMATEMKTEPAALVPPRFTACVAHLEAASGPPAAGAAKPPAAERKSRCEQRYQELRQEVLDRMIADDWLIGGARELGVDVSSRKLATAFAAFKRMHFPTEARYRQYLASSDRTTGDVLFEKRVELDSQAIRDEIATSVGPMTAARVAKYYEQNSALYHVPQTRDVEIAATSTMAQALAVKRQLASGESFAKVVKNLTGGQAALSKEGLVLGLKSGYYREPALNHAIFTARTGVLSGPIKTVIGYYVFRVKRVHPARQEPLAAVRASIKQQLPEQLAQQALVDFIKRWRAKWTARTKCSSGYVVRRCGEFKVTSGTPPEDPYALD